MIKKYVEKTINENEKMKVKAKEQQQQTTKRFPRLSIILYGISFGRMALACDAINRKLIKIMLIYL